MTARPLIRQAEAIHIPRLEVVPRRGLRREDAARYVGISPTKFDQAVNDGRLPQAFRIDGCVLWDIRKLDTAIDALAGNADPDDGWADFDDAHRA